MAAFGWSADAVPIEKLPLFGTVQYSAVPGTTGGANRIPLKSQLFRNCIISTRANPYTNQFGAKTEKRPGLTQNTTISGSSLELVDIIVASWGGGLVHVGTGSSVAHVSLADAVTSLGSLTSGKHSYLSEFDLAGVGYLGVNTTTGYAGYWREDQITTPTTFTGNTTGGSAVVTSIASTATYLVGQGLSGSQIQTGSRILSIDSGTQITMTLTASGSATPATITRQPLAQIIDADYPQATAIGRFAYMDGYAFVMTTEGRIYNSDLGSIASWAASSYLTANAFPDEGVGVLRYKDRIVAFGKISTEFFTNAGNATGSVLLGSSGANIKIGAVGPQAITGVDDTIAWIGLSQQGGIGVYMLNGFSPVKISTDDVEGFLNSSASANPSSTWTLRASYIAGRRLIFMTVNQVSENIPAFVYDIEGKEWSPWHDATVSDAFKFVVYDPFEGVIRVTAGVDEIYRMVYGASTVFSTSTPAVIQLGPWDGGTGNRKFVHSYELQADQLSSGAVIATLEASDDDGQNWSTIGTFNLRDKNPRIFRGGSFTRGRMHRITQTGNNPFGCSYLAVNYDAGQT